MKPTPIYANAYINTYANAYTDTYTKVSIPPTTFIPTVQVVLKNRYPYFYREGTYDLSMFDAVVTHNEYKLGDLRGGIVFDIGAHIGTFTLAAYTHGASQVVAYEPHPENAWLYLANTFSCKSLFPNTQPPVFYWGAVVGDAIENTVGDTAGSKAGDFVPIPLSFPYDPTTSLINTGGLYIEDTVPAYTVPAYCLDDHLKEATLVKLDIESAEYWVLAGSRAVHKVPQVVGEYHLRDNAYGYSVPTHDAAHAVLRSLLPSHTLTFLYQNDNPLGLWFAVKK